MAGTYNHVPGARKISNKNTNYLKKRNQSKRMYLVHVHHLFDSSSSSCWVHVHQELQKKKGLPFPFSSLFSSSVSMGVAEAPWI